MSNRSMPAAPEGRLDPDTISKSKEIQAKWEIAPRAAWRDGREINIFSVIGRDDLNDGTTSAQIGSFLEAMGPGDVTVNIDSPGGDMFAGLAIYNQLIAHQGKVTVNVVGRAASAASVIAMSGDQINMHTSAFLMIHNCHLVIGGNAKELMSVAAMMRPFDSAMADIYVARSSQAKDTVVQMMDNETWMNAEEAVKMGFADSIVTPAAKQPAKLAASETSVVNASIDEYSLAALEALAIQLKINSI
ncbi:head maturation protease [Xanthomonas phage Xop411]|uniref:p08 n=1 Tax=Xanthomonas phage Xop411 TaxID=2913975 RepID=A5H1N7_9CAUD|nr:head maturation protease [Xanthomonas phage Xop411]ABK00156.1 p08 [Xanthomonas phage Xop411]